YLWALSYHLGFCSYFKIPYEFISLNPTIVLATSRIPLYAVSVLIASFILTLLISSTPTEYLFIPMIILFTISMIIIIILSALRQDWIGIVFLPVFFLIIIFGPPLIEPREKGSYWNRLQTYLAPLRHPPNIEKVTPVSPRLNPRQRGLIEILFV